MHRDTAAGDGLTNGYLTNFPPGSAADLLIATDGTRQEVPTTNDTP